MEPQYLELYQRIQAFDLEYTTSLRGVVKRKRGPAPCGSVGRCVGAGWQCKARVAQPHGLACRTRCYKVTFLSAGQTAMTLPASPADHDHLCCVNQAIRRAEQLCTDRGAKLTPIRRKVLELVWESHRAVKAYDLLDRIRPLEQAAKPATVYRALDFLLEQGLIHRVESLNAFVGCACSGERHELLLLICKACQDVEERSAPAVMAAVAEEIAQAGFAVHRMAIEVHGLCRRCAQAE